MDLDSFHVLFFFLSLCTNNRLLGYVHSARARAMLQQTVQDQGNILVLSTFVKLGEQFRPLQEWLVRQG